MRKLWFIFYFLLIPLTTKSQKIYPKSATLTFTQSNSVILDGKIYFEIDLRMSDCLSHIEVKDLDNYKEKKNIWDKIHDWWYFKVRKKLDFQFSKIYKFDLNQENYFLSTDDERIYMKCELMTLKSLYGRKKIEKKLEINLYSKTSKKIYSKQVILNKLKLIEDSEIRIGIK